MSMSKKKIITIILLGMMAIVAVVAFTGCAGDYETKAIKEIDTHGEKATNILATFFKWASYAGLLISFAWYQLDTEATARKNMRIYMMVSGVLAIALIIYQGSFI